MKKFIFLFLIFFPFLFKAEAQSNFIKTFTNGESWFVDMILTKDSGIVILSRDFILPSAGPCLIKTNTKGEVIWQKSYSTKTYPTSFCLSENNGFIIVGNDATGFSWIKTDSLGNIIGKKYFNFSGLEELKIKKLNPSLYLITSGTLIVKINEEGNILFSKQIISSFEYPGICDFIYKDKKIIIGLNGYKNDSSQFNLVQLDTLGNIIFSKRIKPISSQKELRANKFIETRDNGVLIIGAEQNSNAKFLLKLNSSYEIDWSNSYNINSDFNPSPSLIEDEQKNIVIATSFIYEYGTAGQYAIIDSIGNAVEARFLDYDVKKIFKLNNKFIYLSQFGNSIIEISTDSLSHSPCGSGFSDNYIEKDSMNVKLDNTSFSVSSYNISQSSFTISTNNLEWTEGHTCLYVGINDPELREKIKLYPNPLSDNSVIDFSESPNFINIEIYNFFGQLIKKERIKNASQYSLSKNDFQPGCYLYKLSNNKDFITGKFIVN